MPRWTRSTSSPIYTPDPVVREHPLARGLVGWWAGMPNNSGGTRVYDLLGYANATLPSTASWASRQRPGGFTALDFTTGTTGATVSDVANRYNWNAVNAFSCSFWWMPSVGNTQGQIVSASAGAGGNGYWFVRCSTGGALRFQRGSGASQNGIGFTGVSLTNNVWSHIVVTFEHPTLRTYFNGLATSSTPNSVSTTWTAGGSFNFGSLTETDATHGWIDDVRLWNRGLTAAEVAAVYAESRIGYPETIRRYQSSATFYLPPPSTGTLTATLGNLTLTGTATSTAPPSTTGGLSLSFGSLSLTATATSTAPPATSGGLSITLGSLSLTASATSVPPPNTSGGLSATLGGITLTAGLGVAYGRGPTLAYHTTANVSGPRPTWASATITTASPTRATGTLTTVDPRHSQGDPS